MADVVDGNVLVRWLYYSKTLLARQPIFTIKFPAGRMEKYEKGLGPEVYMTLLSDVAIMTA
jgi:hypothetical protein